MEAIFFIICFVIVIFEIAAIWRLYEKADQAGWAAFVPIYDLYILLEIADKPGWWLLLFFIPGVSFVVNCLVFIAIAQNFNKGIGFGLGLIFLPFIFIPIIAFGDAQYS